MSTGLFSVCSLVADMTITRTRLSGCLLLGFLAVAQGCGQADTPEPAAAPVPVSAADLPTEEPSEGASADADAVSLLDAVAGLPAEFLSVEGQATLVSCALPESWDVSSLKTEASHEWCAGDGRWLFSEFDGYQMAHADYSVDLRSGDGAADYTAVSADRSEQETAVVYHTGDWYVSDGGQWTRHSGKPSGVVQADLFESLPGLGLLYSADPAQVATILTEAAYEGHDADFAPGGGIVSASADAALMELAQNSLAPGDTEGEAVFWISEEGELSGISYQVTSVSDMFGVGVLLELVTELSVEPPEDTQRPGSYALAPSG